MVTKTGLIIVYNGKKVEVYTKEELKNYPIKNGLFCNFKKLFKL